MTDTTDDSDSPTRHGTDLRVLPDADADTPPEQPSKHRLRYALASGYLRLSCRYPDCSFSGVVSDDTTALDVKLNHEAATDHRVAVRLVSPGTDRATPHGGPHQ